MKRNCRLVTIGAKRVKDRPSQCLRWHSPAVTPVLLATSSLMLREFVVSDADVLKAHYTILSVGKERVTNPKNVCGGGK